jgi:hypothetical protein
MLVNHPAFYLSFYVLSRDPQGRLRYNKTLNRDVSCEPVSDFISSYPSTPRDPIQPHSVPGANIIQRFLAQSHQWGRCFNSLKCFQGRHCCNGCWLTRSSQQYKTVECCYGNAVVELPNISHCRQQQKLIMYSCIVPDIVRFSSHLKFLDQFSYKSQHKILRQSVRWEPR